MYVKYFVISKEWYPTRHKYISVPFGSVDMAREHANVLALDFPKNRYYICEAVEYVQAVESTFSDLAVQTVQLDNY